MMVELVLVLVVNERNFLCRMWSAVKWWQAVGCVCPPHTGLSTELHWTDTWTNNYGAERFWHLGHFIEFRDRGTQIVIKVDRGWSWKIC